MSAAAERVRKEWLRRAVGTDARAVELRCQGEALARLRVRGQKKEARDELAAELAAELAELAQGDRREIAIVVLDARNGILAQTTVRVGDARAPTDVRSPGALVAHAIRLAESQTRRADERCDRADEKVERVYGMAVQMTARFMERCSELEARALDTTRLHEQLLTQHAQRAALEREATATESAQVAGIKLLGEFKDALTQHAQRNAVGPKVRDLLKRLHETAPEPFMALLGALKSDPAALQAWEQLHTLDGAQKRTGNGNGHGPT